MSQRHINNPAEVAILRFCVDMLHARNDEDEVQRIIDKKLATYDAGEHVSLLKVALRVVVAQFFAPPARRLDRELGYDFVDAGLRLQALDNDGLFTREEDD
ncbi:hypothetical protein [Nonomuraea sediminis]|uniref:hypothetical protein n=1 Tax=Nonomuraea sediminis TaxID=2835864 RepID=UPI001BDC4521|nr:hypothetical protein [Nonomuraea sediminis]